MFKRIIISFIMANIAFAASADVRFWKHVWKQTDFSQTSIDFKTVLQGGPGKDGIPALSDPVMISVDHDTLLAPNEPVMSVELDGQAARAYPIRYLMWHEIVNDSVGDIPFAVTFCPLCNSGVVFDRRLNGKTYTLGVSGMLRNSDMIMYDRETESWWQQFTGEAIVGDLLGQKLTKIPGWMESWETFKARNPDGLVQAEPKTTRRYGQNPYSGYDTGRPFLYNGENPPFGINPLARVVAIENQAWPLERIRKMGSISESGYVISWNSGTASALDQRDIASGRNVGAIRVKDASGNDVVHDVAFAFAFHAFHPDGQWMLEK
jgi:hypothetical protein